MKCSVSNSASVFTPVTFNIIIESENELLEFYHRFNVSIPFIYSKGYKSDIKISKKPNCNFVWNGIREVLEERGIK